MQQEVAVLLDEEEIPEMASRVFQDGLKDESTCSTLQVPPILTCPGRWAVNGGLPLGLFSKLFPQGFSVVG